MIYGLLGAALMLLWLFCIIDVIVTPGDEAKHLPKLMWLAIVVLLGTIGSLAWLLVGRPWANGSPLERALGRPPGPRRASDLERPAPAFPEYDRPGRVSATNPDDDEAFLRQVRERAEAQRRAETERRRARERTERSERPQPERDDDPA